MASCKIGDFIFRTEIKYPNNIGVVRVATPNEKRNLYHWDNRFHEPIGSERNLFDVPYEYIVKAFETLFPGVYNNAGVPVATTTATSDNAALLEALKAQKLLLDSYISFVESTTTVAAPTTTVAVEDNVNDDSAEESKEDIVAVDLKDESAMPDDEDDDVVFVSDTTDSSDTEESIVDRDAINDKFSNYNKRE